MVTDIIGGVTGGVSGNPLEVVTDIIGGVTGGVDGNPLEVITDIIGGVTGGVDGNPLEVITDIIGGVTGGIGDGTSPISPVIDVVQGGIDILQGVESLKLKLSTLALIQLQIQLSAFFHKQNILFLNLQTSAH